jgi:hypothetical protein
MGVANCYDSGVIRNLNSSHIKIIHGFYPPQAIIVDSGKESKFLRSLIPIGSVRDLRGTGE